MITFFGFFFIFPLTFSKIVGIITDYEKKYKSGLVQGDGFATADASAARKGCVGNAQCSGCTQCQALYTDGQGRREDTLPLCSGVDGGESPQICGELEGVEVSHVRDERVDANTTSRGDSSHDRKDGGKRERCSRGRKGRRSEGKQKVAKAEKPKRNLKRRPGRRPGKNPSGRNAAEKFFCWIHPILSGINGLFSLALKIRSERFALYDNATLLWTVVMGLFCRRTTRNKMDGDRNDTAYALNIFRFSQQSFWAEGEEKTVPCTQLVFNWLKKVKMRYLDILLAEVFNSFVDAKLLEKALLCGCFVVVLDGTKVDERWGTGLTGHKRNRMALEAKVITPWKWALTVAVVPIRPWRNDAEKQDCELKAFDLMVKKLKRVFGRKGVILMGDALYACQKGMDTCRDNGWHYIFVFKEGRSSSVFKEAQALMNIDQGKYGPIVGNCRDKGKTVVGGVRWANAVLFGEHLCNVVECSQLIAADDMGTYYGQFITDLDITHANRAVEIARWGRLRWVIENSFKTQKRKGEDGFGLEHTFCKDEHASRAVHMLMQLAHNLWQVFESGIVRNLSKGVCRPTQSLWAKKICEALHYYDFSEMEIVTVYLNHEYERLVIME